MKLLKRAFILMLLIGIVMVASGAAVLQENLIPADAFESDTQDEDPFWLVSGTDGASYRLLTAKSAIDLTLDKNGYLVVRAELEVEPNAIYAISYRVMGEKGSVFCRVDNLSLASGDSIGNSEGESTTFYGKTGEDQTHFSINFWFGTPQNPQEGNVQLSDIRVERVESAPEGSEVCAFYSEETPQTPEQTEETQQDKNESLDTSGILPVMAIAVAMFVAIAFLIQTSTFELPDLKQRRVWPMLIFAGAIYFIVAALMPGHATDMSCFTAWANQMAISGPQGFYTSGIFADYPPGYLWVLYPIGLIARLAGFTVGSPWMNALIKSPAILADLACAYLLYRFARSRIGGRNASNVMLLYLLNPAVILNSAIWGQVDSVLTLVIVAMMTVYQSKLRPVCAKPIIGALFTLGVLIKPQMLMFGPIMAVAFLRDLFVQFKKEILGTLLAFFTAAATLFLVAFPFTGEQSPLWLLELYQNAAGSYPYASVNAFNFFALLGGNWQADSEMLIGGISYRTAGWIGIALACILGAVLFLKAKEKYAIFPVSAVTVWGIFFLGHSMHERYLFPAFLLLLYSYAVYRERKLLFAAAMAAGVLLANVATVLLNMGQWISYLAIAIVAVCNLIGYIFCIYATVTAIWNDAQSKHKPLGATSGDKQTEKSPPEQEMLMGRDKIFSFEHEQETDMEYILQENVAPTIEAQETSDFVETMKGEETFPSGKEFSLPVHTGRLVKKDRLFILLLVVAYAFVMLFRLGSTNTPQSYFRATQAGESYLIDFGTSVEIAYVYYYPGIGEGTFSLAASEDGDQYQTVASIQLDDGEMYTWQTRDCVAQGRYFLLKVESEDVFLNELAFYDAAGNLVQPVSAQAQGQASADPEKLFDEPARITQSPSYMDEMYFDEIYHARTAFEHLTGMAPYENSHPPLGKILIMLGISIFGMNPFGWRIVGALFGIAILPMFYLLAKRIFRRSNLAQCCTLLLAMDGMLLAQSRIATIDTFTVFFILGMYYFMYRYYEMNFFRSNLRHTFVPLGLCGIFFGLGFATKWIGAYAGAGLAVIFFYTLYCRYKDYRMAKMLIAQGDQREEMAQIAKTFLPKTIKTLAFCVGFFILVPAAIYLLAYLPYFLCMEHPYTLADVWGVQEFMFSYHSGLQATHPFASPWYEWPLVYRPIWFYQGTHVADGMFSSIASFGNPLVWWMGLAAVFYALLTLRRRRPLREKRTAGFLLVGLAAVFLPWVLIPRITFIYHYYASVPFIILLLGFVFRDLDEAGARWVKWLAVGLCAAAFLLFYPVWTGLEVPMAWARLMQWFPSWYFGVS